ncbi:MAG: DNA replication/repair protein RecF [Bacilli bacterium]|nr:DNA replication/repair protein RecF [Bacilli bacterium]
MILKKLELKNFRNYDNLELNFDKKINIFIGNNAQGKTNILESIYVLALTKSHRTNKDTYLIKQNSLFTKVIGSVEENSKSTNYEILINTEGKRVSINSNPLKKVSEYLSRINAIMFCPDDLEIIKGTPLNRRSFFNVEISGLSNNYVKYLSDYNKILKTRNEYLKTTEKVDFDYFNIITDKLIMLNIQIYKERRDFVNKINKYIKTIYKDISGKEDIVVKYDSFIDNEENDKYLYFQLQNKYEGSFNNELYQKVTLLGVHKDDFSIFIDGVKINNYGSQGQHRISILCLKLAEIEIYKNEYKKEPILLLDDIFSELDRIKKVNIINYIKNDLQVFITSTDLDNIDKKIVKDADIFTIKEGKVTRGD